MSDQHCVFLGTPGFVRDPGRFRDDILLQVLGANAGNLMFQYATSRLIAAPLRHVSSSDIPYADTSVLAGARALIFPAANHLRAGADWTGLNNYLESCQLPLVVPGLGAQSPGLDAQAATIAQLKADPHVLRLVHILRERAEFVSVRGAFSQKVCAALGLPDVEVLGCPSAMLNPDRELGKTMAAKLIAARDGQPHIDLTAAAPFEIRGAPLKADLERRLLEWAMASGGQYIQQSGGVATMLASNGQWFRLDRDTRRAVQDILAPGRDPVDFWAFMAGSARFHLSAPDWIGSLAGRDVMMGTRIHGCMAAIAAGTPGVLIAHDSRTAELRQTMHLPQLSVSDVMTAGSAAQALARVRFDPKVFDSWRNRTATALCAAFDRLGILVSPHLRQLAG